MEMVKEAECPTCGKLKPTYGFIVLDINEIEFISVCNECHITREAEAKVRLEAHTAKLNASKLKLTKAKEESGVDLFKQGDPLLDRIRQLIDPNYWYEHLASTLGRMRDCKICTILKKEGFKTKTGREFNKGRLRHYKEIIWSQKHHGPALRARAQNSSRGRGRRLSGYQSRLQQNGSKKCSRCEEFKPTNGFIDLDINENEFISVCKKCRLVIKREEEAQIRLKECVRMIHRDKDTSGKFFNSNAWERQIELEKQHHEYERKFSRNYYHKNKEKFAAYNKERRKNIKKQETDKLNEIYRTHKVPEYLWHKDEFPKEKDFQKAIEHVIVNRYGTGIERWVDLKEHGVPDIYIPYVDLIIEVKLESSKWSSEKVVEQGRRYQEISPTVIVSLDGQPLDWHAEEDAKEILLWFAPETLFRFLDDIISEKRTQDRDSY